MLILYIHLVENFYDNMKNLLFPWSLGFQSRYDVIAGSMLELNCR